MKNEIQYFSKWDIKIYTVLNMFEKTPTEFIVFNMNVFVVILSQYYLLICWAHSLIPLLMVFFIYSK